MSQTRYEILMECSPRDGAAVYLALDHALNRDVELRVGRFPDAIPRTGEFSLETPGDPALARFFHEPRVLSLLEHTAIPRVIDAGRWPDDSCYYVMPPGRGEPLQSRIRSAHSFEERIRWLPEFLSAARAVAYCHGRGIVHRDLNPREILVGENGEVAITGWHRASVANHPEWLKDLEWLREAPQGIALTPGFRAPELRAEAFVANDATLDVFALGAVLHFVLTGNPPGKPTDTKSIPGRYRGLLDVAAQAMRGSPQERYATAEEFVYALEPLIAGGMGSQRRKIPEGVAARRAVKRKKFAIGAAAVLGTIGLAAAGLLWNLYGRPAPRHGLATTPRSPEELRRIDFGIQAELSEATDDGEQLERLEYWAELVSASWHIERGNYGPADAALKRASETWRNWEWGYLARMTHLYHRSIEAQTPMVYRVRFSADGERILAAGVTPPVNEWSIDAGRIARSYEGLQGETRHVEYSADGNYVIASGSSGVALVWETQTGRLLRQFEGHRGGIGCAAMSPDGQIVATGGNDSKIRLWSLQSGEELALLEGHSGRISALAFSYDGARLISGSWDGALIAWEIEVRSQEYASAGPDGSVVSLALAPDGATFATSGTNGTVYIHDAESGEKLRSLEGHQNTVWQVVFSPDGGLLATAGWDGAARLWNPLSGKCLAVIGGHRAQVNTVAFRPDGKMLATGSDDGTIKVWDVAEWMPEDAERLGSPAVKVARIPFETPRLSTVALSSDTAVIAAGAGRSVRVYMRETLEEVFREEVTDGRVTAMQISPDNRVFAYGTSQGAARFVSLEDGKTVVSFEAQNGSGLNFQSRAVRAVAISADRRFVALGTQEGLVEIWDTKADARAYRFTAHGNRVAAMTFSPAFEQLVTAGTDGLARLWEDGNSARSVHDFKGHASRIDSVSFSPGGRYMLTASADRTARLWDMESGAETGLFAAHRSGVRDAVFTPDGSRIVTAGDDAAVWVWDVQTGRELARLDMWDHAPIDLAVSLDGRTIVVVSLDKTVISWDAESWRSEDGS